MAKKIGTCVFKGCSRFTYGWDHHRKQRSAGGSDNDANLVNICFEHHNWVHEHLERSHELGLIIWDHEPEPTEKLLEVVFRKRELPTKPRSPKVEAELEELLFQPNLQNNDETDD